MNKRRNQWFSNSVFLYLLNSIQNLIYLEKSQKDLKFIQINCQEFLQKFDMFVFWSYSKLF